jgi:hypothetical protein
MKGRAIRFIAGKYAGKKGWIDIDGKEGDSTTPVIVYLGKKGEKPTYVNDSNFENEPTIPPSCYAEAVIQQCPDLQKLLVCTCRAFAKADIGNDTAGLYHILERTMKEALQWQTSKGSKALYRKVYYIEHKKD